MEKIINVKVSGSEIEQSSTVGGIQGEGGARSLKISFDTEWNIYSKSVTFLDANLSNAVKVMLTTANKNADGSYTVKIPAEPLKTGGRLTYIIEGSSSGVLQRSVKKELKVKYAPVVSSTSSQAAVTPSVADQLNLSIQNESKRINTLETKIDTLETKAESVDGDIANLEELVAINKDALSKKADISYVDNKVPKKATESQAMEGTNDTEFMTPLMSKKQFNHLFSASDAAVSFATKNLSNVSADDIIAKLEEAGFSNNASGDSADGGGLKIATGSYQGDGVSVKPIPFSDFAPKIWIITTTISGTEQGDMSPPPAIIVSGQTAFTHAVFADDTYTTLNWVRGRASHYTGALVLGGYGSVEALNASTYTYNYVAIG